MPVWFRLLYLRIRAWPCSPLLNDKGSLRVLRGMAALVAVGALFFLVFPGGFTPHHVLVSGSADTSVQVDVASASLFPVFPGGSVLGDQAVPARVVAIQEDASPYREGVAAPLADIARQVDAALIQVMARLNISSDDFDAIVSEVRFDLNGQAYPFLRVSLPGPPGVSLHAWARAFSACMEDSLKVWAPKARLRKEGDALFFVVVDKLVTHSIRLGDTLPPVQDADDARPRLTIVIDDVGENLAAVRKLVVLPYPVTVSIWPRSAYAAYSATLAEENRLQVFVHQPMQARSIGSGQIRSESMTVGMPRVKLAEVLRDSLSQVPYAEGINNHMGSRFTTDVVSVKVFCEELHRLRPDIIVLDSLTHGASVLYAEARQQGFTAFQRDVFLDDEHEEHDKASVLKQLDLGLTLARKHGQAVVIGHPKASTLAALAAWTGYRANDVQIIPLAARPDNVNGGKPAPSLENP